MAIKPIGVGTTPVKTNVESTTSLTGANKREFAAAVSQTPATAAASTANATPLQSAVQSAVEQVRAGKLEPGRPTVDAVIRTMIETQMADASPAAVRKKVEIAQITLGEDPMFCAQIDRLVKSAMEKSPAASE